MYILKKISHLPFLRRFLTWFWIKCWILLFHSPERCQKLISIKNCNHTSLLFIELFVPRQESELSLICMVSMLPLSTILCLVPTVWYFLFGSDSVVFSAWFRQCGIFCLVPTVWYFLLGSDSVVCSVWFQHPITQYIQIYGSFTICQHFKL